MSDRVPISPPRRIFRGLVLVLIGIVYGFYANFYHWWAADRIFQVHVAFEAVLSDLRRPWYLSLEPSETDLEIIDGDALAPGLVLIAGVSADDQNYIDIIDRAGEIVHSWQPNWFDIWPNGPEGIPSERLPKKLPGAIIHGVQIADNGDVVLNYEFLSTIRLDVCGNVKWRLDNLGHHAVDFADDGTIWVGSERWLVVGPSSYENQIGPMSSWAIEQLDQDGNQLQKKEIFEILVENDLRGLMHLSTLDNMRTEVVSDTLHLNDVEIFPSGQPSEIFSPGDILISLRNISTIIVVDPETWKVKFRSTGPVLRPHDADFAPNSPLTKSALDASGLV